MYVTYEAMCGFVWRIAAWPAARLRTGHASIMRRSNEPFYDCFEKFVVRIYTFNEL